MRHFIYDTETTLRLTIVNQAPWFYGHDFCARLGYTDVETMRYILWPDQFRIVERDEDLHIDRDETLVSLSGLFRCINEAPGYYAVGGLDAPWEDVHLKFRAWVEREVVPQAWRAALRPERADPRIEYLRQFSPLSWDMKAYERPADPDEDPIDATRYHLIAYMDCDRRGGPINPIHEALKIIREVKSIWGKQAAQDLWDYLGLPTADAYTRSSRRL